MPAADPDSTVKQEYRNLLFMFTNVLLHEMADVFITYLTQGKDGTPDNMKPYASWYSWDEPAESGHKLQMLAFGGPVNYWRDPDTEAAEDQVCSK